MNESPESVHLNVRNLDAYRNRTLDPAALLAAADHLAECPECRARAALDPLPIGHLRQSLEPDHLTEAELSSFAEDSLTDPKARQHLAECDRCTEDAEDLRRFVQTQRPTASPWFRTPSWPIAAAAAVCASLVVGWFVTRPTPQSTLAAPAAVSVAALPDDLRNLRDAAIASGRLQIPSNVAALQGARETQLGTGAAPPAVQLEAPVNTATLSARPEFRWKPVPRANSYQVGVFDSEFRRVASSGALHDTRWTPPRDLNPGTVYVWELTVVVDGSRRTAPHPPELPARFLVLPEAERNRLSGMAARYPQEHLLLGVVFANAGALDAARRELQAARAQGHSEAARLLSTF